MRSQPLCGDQGIPDWDNSWKGGLQCSDNSVVKSGFSSSWRRGRESVSSKGLRHQPRQVHNPGMQRSVHSGWVRAITSTCVRCAEIHLTSGRGHHCCLLVQGSGHTDVRGEGEGSELSQFSCSTGGDAVGGKEGRAGNCWEHCRRNAGRCKLSPCGGSTSIGENHHLAFAHFKTKPRGGVVGLREDRCGPEWNAGVGEGEGSISHPGDHSTGDAQQGGEASLHSRDDRPRGSLSTD